MSESDDLRTFIREITLRFERGIDRISGDMRSDLAAHRSETRQYFERIDRKLEDQLAESRAQRAALLHILDELRGSGGSAAAG
jgi:hypothetical protein